MIALIPARGGSQRIPHKNIRDFCGKPLISWTIEQAIQSNVFEEIYVSTDDEKIAGVAKQFGCEIPFMRPKELAADNTPHLPVIQHAVNWLKENEKYDNQREKVKRYD